MIAHVVLFQPKADVTAAEKAALVSALQDACRDLPGLIDAHIGRAVDIGANYRAGFGETTYEYVAVLEFIDRNGVLTYLRRPEHEAVGALFWKTCEKTTIFDFEIAEVSSSAARLLANDQIE